VIDLHSHILPGVDDGAPTADVALEMARDASRDGITTIAATPHVREGFQTAPERMEHLVGVMQAAIREADIQVDLLPGGELGLDALFELADEQLRRFGLGGNPDCLLVEVPYHGWQQGLDARLDALRERGFLLVLAHPERNSAVQARPEVLSRAVDSGAIVQLTAASLDGRLGERPRRTCMRLLELGLAHLLASDAHAPTIRQIGLSSAAREVDDEALARWLTLDVPAAIVAGRPLPRRPVWNKGRRQAWWPGRARLLRGRGAARDN